MIITGCQRSGTMTCAKIFGLEHEVLYNPSTTLKGLKKLSPTTPLWEASWMAQPFTSFLLERGESIIHLVRHPLNVIRSLMGIKFFHSEAVKGHKPYRDFIFKYLTFLKEMSEIEKCIYYYIKWNEPLDLLVESGKVARIRIEDIYTKQRWNQRKRADIVWDDFPRDARGELQEMAKEYSYDY